MKNKNNRTSRVGGESSREAANELPISSGSDQTLDNGYKIEVLDGDGDLLSWVKIAKPEQENYMIRAIQKLIYPIIQKAKEGHFPEDSCWVSVRGEGKYR